MRSQSVEQRSSVNQQPRSPIGAVELGHRDFGGHFFDDPVQQRPLVREVTGWLFAVKRALYGGDQHRPGAFMRALNRLDARLYASGRFTPRHTATLEVTGRRSGRTISLPIAVAEHGGQRYLVSMLGEDASWVRNVRAAGGRAVLRRRGRTNVILEEVPEADRAPVLRRYLEIAPGARPHIPVRRRAPLAQFEQIAHRYPVFVIREHDADSAEPSIHNVRGCGWSQDRGRSDD